MPQRWQSTWYCFLLLWHTAEIGTNTFFCTFEAKTWKIDWLTLVLTLQNEHLKQNKYLFALILSNTSNYICWYLISFSKIWKIWNFFFENLSFFLWNCSNIVKKSLFLDIFRNLSFLNRTLGLRKSLLNQTTYVQKNRLCQQSFLNRNFFLTQAFLYRDSAKVLSIAMQ